MSKLKGLVEKVLELSFCAKRLFPVVIIYFSFLQFTQAAEHIVEMPGVRFSGQEIKKDEKENINVLKVKLGDTVKFVNNSTVSHMVNTFHPELMWNLGDQKPNQAVIMRSPKKAGRYEIMCGYHSHMKMVVDYEQ